MSEQKEQVCECGHPESHHRVSEICLDCASINGRYHKFTPRKERGDDMQPNSAIGTIQSPVYGASQPSPESSTQAGTKTFEEWVIKTGRSLDSFHSDLALQQAYEAGQSNAPAPGRWVKCSERLPDSRGYYPYFDGTGIRELWFNNETDKDRWGSGQWWEWRSGQWWEWAYTITQPPAVERDEDEKAMNEAFDDGIRIGDIGMFRAGWKARTALKHAREKGKP